MRPAARIPLTTRDGNEDAPIDPGASSFPSRVVRSEEHTSELQSLTNLVCRLLLEKKNNTRLPDLTVPWPTDDRRLTYSPGSCVTSTSRGWYVDRHPQVTTIWYSDGYYGVARRGYA